MSTSTRAEVSWERMSNAIERVRARLLKAARALDAAAIDYAVVGGNAVAAWVSRVDEAAVRNTQDVVMLLRRESLPLAIRALEAAGFVYRHSASIHMFLDGPDARARDALHIIFADERVRPDYALPSPSVDESEVSADFRLVSLDALVRMKLTSFRDKDRVHIRDLIGVGLVDESWLERVSPSLRDRLQAMLDDPEG